MLKLYMSCNFSRSITETLTMLAPMLSLDYYPTLPSLPACLPACRLPACLTAFQTHLPSYKKNGSFKGNENIHTYLNVEYGYLCNQRFGSGTGFSIRLLFHTISLFRLLVQPSIFSVSGRQNFGNYAFATSTEPFSGKLSCQPVFLLQTNSCTLISSKDNA